MIQDIPAAVAMVMALTFPAYILPVILGPIILARYRQDEISRLAGYLTLKPILATPLWFLIGAGTDALDNGASAQSRFITLIPAITLTLLILCICRRSLAANKGLVVLFLLADALRWINTYSWMANNPSIPDLSNENYTMGLLLPNLIAIMAIIIMFTRVRKRHASAINEGVSP